MSKSPRVRVRYEKCSITVEGTEMNCPMCKVLVKSGETHKCEAAEYEEPVKPKASKLKPGETR